MPAKASRGGVTLLVINADRQRSFDLNLPTASERYTLTAKQLEDTTVELNGKPLRLTSSGDLPQFKGEPVNAGRVELCAHQHHVFKYCKRWQCQLSVAIARGIEYERQRTTSAEHTCQSRHAASRSGIRLQRYPLSPRAIDAGEPDSRHCRGPSPGGRLRGDDVVLARPE